MCLWVHQPCTNILFYIIDYRFLSLLLLLLLSFVFILKMYWKSVSCKRMKKTEPNGMRRRRRESRNAFVYMEIRIKNDKWTNPKEEKNWNTNKHSQYRATLIFHTYIFYNINCWAIECNSMTIPPWFCALGFYYVLFFFLFFFSCVHALSKRLICPSTELMLFFFLWFCIFRV